MLKLVFPLTFAKGLEEARRELPQKLCLLSHGRVESFVTLREAFEAHSSDVDGVIDENFNYFDFFISAAEPSQHHRDASSRIHETFFRKANKNF